MKMNRLGIKNYVIVFTVLLLLTASSSFAQSGIIQGRVSDPINNEPVMFANVLLQNTDKGTTTDIDGNYKLENLEPGTYNVVVSYIGYKSSISFEVEVTNSRPTEINIKLEQNSEDLKEVVVKASPFNKSEESPVSLRNIGVAEIQRNPGGNRDISRVIQSLPGVTTTASFRNDLLIRGGAPNENRFYLDDVEVPVINHFSTQGASGGPVGMINVDFIREVDFFSGAFPANRGNTLSSVFNFKQKDGRSDRLGMRATVGSSDLALTLEGPINDKTTFLFSARQSYLQFLFKLLELPFLPIYNDFQVKVKYKPDTKNEFTFIGIGAIDNFDLNLEANETEEQQFTLGNIRGLKQWNYTNGLVYKNYRDNGYLTVVLSRSMLDNTSDKYLDNDDSDPNNLIFDYASQEIENKIRVENTEKIKGYRLNYGINYEYARYNNSTFNKVSLPDGTVETIDYNAELDMNKYGLFGSVSKKYVDDRLILSLGFRADGNDYSDEMSNPFTQFSPRFSAAFAATEQLIFNFNAGVYYQLPPYTVLGYQENGQFVNRNNNISFINSNHLVAGVEYNTSSNSKLTLEGYYKSYSNYPFLLRDSITLANLGGDFGVLGNEEAVSTKAGRSYGLEVLFQQKLFKGFYGIAAYTLGVTEFEDKNDVYVPSSWDSRHILSLTLGKQFKGNWEIGAKWRYQSGLPETPYAENSNLVPLWNVNGRAVFNYNLLNTERGQAVHALDFRVDKKWFFDKWSLNVYFDVQNLYGATRTEDELILDKDEAGNPVVINPLDPLSEQRYRLKTLLTENGSTLPGIGIVVEF